MSIAWCKVRCTQAGGVRNVGVVSKRGYFVSRNTKVIFGELLTALIVIVILTEILNLTRQSSAEVITKTLESALIKKQLPDYNLLINKSSGNIIVSNENIDTSWIPQLTGIRLTVLPPSAIQEKANKDGEFLYLRFKKIEIGKLIATVSLDNVWASPSNKNNGYLSGGGYTLKFYNILGNWVQSRMVESWIS